MNTYGRLWWVVAIPLAALGAAEALLAVPPRVDWTTATIGGVVSGLCCLAHLSREGTRSARTGVVVSVACWGALACVSACGLGVLLGGVAALLLVLLVCLHPRVVGGAAARARRWLRPGTDLAAPSPVGGRPEAASARVLPSLPAARGSARPFEHASPTTPTTDSFAWPDAAAVRLLSTSQLCWGWRVSFAALERARDDRRRWTVLVEVRQRYLDEIARRDQAGLTRWLYAGARPAGDPSRYLLAGRDRPATSSAPPSSAAGPTPASGPTPTEADGPDA